MQNSRECTKRAINFDYPDRIPMCTVISPTNQYDIETGKIISAAYPSDIIFAVNHNSGFIPEKPGQDEWGCVWETLGFTLGEVKEHPLADWSNFDIWKEKMPDFGKIERYSHAKSIREQNPDKYVVGAMGLMMNLIYNLRGMENFFTDLYLEREKLDTLIDIIYRSAFDQIDRYAQAGLDGVIVWEDWGLQDRLMMSPGLWRNVFKEKMRKMVEYIHSKNMHYILHCCGYILDIFDDLVEIGIDVIQLDQQKQMGIAQLKKYAGRICFFNPADISFLSNNNDLEAIRNYCVDMAENLSTDNGGFMYKLYGMPKSCEISVEALIEECRTFKGYNPYAGYKGIVRGCECGGNLND